MNRDLSHDIKSVESIAPQTITANTNGSGVDTQGYDSTTVNFQFGGTVQAGTTIKVQDSDDDITYADATFNGGAADSDLTKDPASITPAINSIYNIGYVGKKRYVRAVVLTTVGTDVASQVILGHPELRPVDAVISLS